MSVNLPTHWKTSKVRAVELLVSQPSARIKDVADESGVSSVTIHKWLKDPEFVEVFYQRYMISFGSKLPAVLSSMIREAEAGNVQAGRLVLEHSGKLIKRVEVANHQSPFEKFLNAEISEATVIEELEITEPVTNKPPSAVETVKIKTFNAKDVKIKKRKTAKQWRDRARVVSVALLPKGRKTPAQKEAWQNLVKEKEKQLL
tara:strand:- start:878 stop:1483 length:606 start_codon:yes stop_codon:yes gene_type:complete